MWGEGFIKIVLKSDEKYLKMCKIELRLFIGVKMIELQNICWSAAEGKQVLRNVNLKLDDNRLIAISGPNGGGKTTLARILMGLEMPDSGKIFLDNKDITSCDVTERANLGLSFGFQQPVHFKGITVKRLLELSAGRELSEEESYGLLHKVGLCPQDYIGRDVDATLSGGEIKRIEIASVFARNTRYVIFDEPEAGIDLWSFESLIDVFEEMRQEHSRTLIVITHQERILKVADEIVVIANGAVTEKGPGSVVLKKMLCSNSCNARSCGKLEAVNE